jgi:uncharacterized protein (TIGR02246 family)
VDEGTLRQWMEGYLRAWQGNDPEDIGALFTDDALYYTAPWREPWSGRRAIVEGWLEKKDQPGEWSFRWEPFLAQEDLAIVRGWTSYPKEGQEYSNLWIIRFTQDGRASEFTEWWMLHGFTG